MINSLLGNAHWLLLAQMRHRPTVEGLLLVDVEAELVQHRRVRDRRARLGPRLPCKPREGRVFSRGQRVRVGRLRCRLLFVGHGLIFYTGRCPARGLSA